MLETLSKLKTVFENLLQRITYPEETKTIYILVRRQNIGFRLILRQHNFKPENKNEMDLLI